MQILEMFIDFHVVFLFYKLDKYYKMHYSSIIDPMIPSLNELK